MISWIIYMKILMKKKVINYNEHNTDSYKVFDCLFDRQKAIVYFTCRILSNDEIQNRL